MKTTDYKEIMRICEDLENTGEIRDMEDVIEHSSEVSKVLQELGVFDDKIESLVVSSEQAFMEQGFIYGFKYAIQLKKECGMI